MNKNFSKKVLRKLNRETENILRKVDSSFREKREKKDIFINNSYINLEIYKLELKNKKIEELSKQYLKHRFNFFNLNNISYNINSKERKVYQSNLKYSNEIIAFIDKEYNFIDWQKDINSGYRYDSCKWYKDIKIGSPKGVDIKYPWELSRMNHFPQMAIVAINNESLRNLLIKEYKNQLLDFIATNPIGRGVNWCCTMDVAIRAINILIAYDILIQIDKEKILNQEIQKIIGRSILDHGNFIIENLEWEYGKRANHYLANIIGLLFISAYLPVMKKTSAWLLFSIQELINEVEYQFNEDGSNFEGSTSYHILSSELVCLGTALTLGILENEEKNEILRSKYIKVKDIKRLKKWENQKFDFDRTYFFEKEYIKKVKKMGGFIQDIFNDRYEIPQIGDNDSGRILKISFEGDMLSYENIQNEKFNLLIEKENEKNIYFKENNFNKKYSLDMIYELFYNNKKEVHIEGEIIRALSNNRKLKVEEEKEDNKIELKEVEVEKLKYMKEYTVNFEEIDTAKLKLFKYDNFGICILKSSEVYFSIYYGNNLFIGSGGHSHNDKLSIELKVREKYIFRDSGTGVYTGNPKVRNMFRSIQSHNVPQVMGKEQEIVKGLFSVEKITKTKIINLSKTRITIELNYRDIRIIRDVNIESKKIKIKDYCNYEFNQNFNIKRYSSRYGEYNI